MTSLLAPPVVSLFDELLPVAERLAARLTAGLSDGADDVAQAARVALFEVAGRTPVTDPNAKARCMSRVKGAIFEELRQRDPLSRYTRARLKLLRETAWSLEAELGRVPTDSELAEACGLDVDKVRALNALQAAASTDSVSDHWLDVIGFRDESVASPAEDAEKADVSEALDAAIGRLPELEALVIRRYYLAGETLAVIGAELGHSESYVQQVRVKAERLLRNNPTLKGTFSMRG